MKESISYDVLEQAILDNITSVVRGLSKKTPKIVCPSAKEVKELCLNHDCQYSLKCSNGKCLACGPGIHGNCLTVTIDKVTELVNKKIEPFQ